MENIFDTACDIDNDEIINDLGGSFTSVFQQFVERTDQDENVSRKSSTSSELSIKSEEAQNHSNQNQTNSTIVQRNLELHLSSEAQKKIQDILDEVRQLSEKEKLLLYLKLPTKAGSLADESQPIPLSNTRQEQTQAFQWIRSNLEECESSYTLPKHEVYDDYKSHCESLGATRTLSAPDFGKIIKCVFPRVKARRLGTRGNSKYCYSGLRKKIIKESPSLPNLKGGGGEVNNNESSNQSNEITEDQTLSAACNLVCEWANKLLGRVFSTLLDLARFLVGGSYVSTKSMAAFVVMSATESKVRKMSEKLQLWSSSPSSTESKSSTEGRSSPLRRSASLEYSSPSSKPAVTSSSQKAFLKGQQVQSHTLIKAERPNSLPGIQVVTTMSEFSKMPHQLMSPPPCPPPKTPHHTPKSSPLAVSSPSFASPILTPNRGKTANGHSLLQTEERAFPSMDQNVSGILQSQQAIPQNHVTKAMEHQTHRQTHISRTPVMLRRSDSCPYPSQSPRATRQLTSNSASTALSPNLSVDISRGQSWQSPSGSPCQITMTENTTNIHPVRDIGKLIKKQMVSPIRSPSIQEAMTTPTNRQPPLQRCQSVPVPFTTPQREIYHPLTPQLGGLPGSPAGNRGPSYVQLKERRNAFLGNDVQSNARRNLTPYLLGNEQNPAISMSSKGPGADVGSRSIAVGLENRISVDISDLDNSRKIADVTSRTVSSSNVGNPSAAVIYNNIGNGSMGNPSTTSLGAQQTKQSIIDTITDETPLATVDNLIDPSFSLGDIPTSGGNGLGDLDGLDDATTMDLLRSLNSGNNIWATEWNSSGMQLMESSS